MNKNIIQFWSGGADSTYLLLQNLKAGHKVTVSYIDIDNNKDKTNREHLAIKKLKKDISIFCKHYNLEKPFYTKPSHVLINHPFNKTYCYPQDIVFSMFCTFIEKDYDEIHFGKVLGDEHLDAKLQFFNDVMKANVNFIQSCGETNVSYPKIRFPIRDVSKLAIYSLLSTYDKILNTNFINNITVCENDNKGDRCGCCEPCQKQKKILSELLNLDFLNLNFKYNDIISSDSKIKECDASEASVELTSGK